MLYLYTGQNGGGKTLQAIRKMHECHAQGLDVYASNFNNLRVPFAKHFPNPNDWPLLPEGSVLFIDEAQKIWPKAGAGKAVPEYISQLDIHRQGGIDIYMISPKPTGIHADIRELIAGHYHCVGYGPSQSRIFRFSEFQEDAKSVTARRNAGFEVYKHEKKYYEMYDSASKHLDKPKPPWRQRIGKLLLVLAALIALWIAWELFVTFTGEPSKPKVAAAASPSLSSLLPAWGKSKVALTPEQYLRVMQPRFPEMPGSAPIFDDRKVQAEPAVYCMASGDPVDRCGCLTEQGTVYFFSQNASVHRLKCAYAARWGGAYDPFKRPPREGRSGASNTRERAPAPTAAGGARGEPGAVLEGDAVAAYGYFRDPGSQAKEAEPGT